MINMINNVNHLTHPNEWMNWCENGRFPVDFTIKQRLTYKIIDTESGTLYYGGGLKDILNPIYALSLASGVVLGENNNLIDLDNEIIHTIIMSGDKISKRCLVVFDITMFPYIFVLREHNINYPHTKDKLIKNIILHNKNVFDKHQLNLTDAWNLGLPLLIINRMNRRSRIKGYNPILDKIQNNINNKCKICGEICLSDKIKGESSEKECKLIINENLKGFCSKRCYLINKANPKNICECGRCLD